MSKISDSGKALGKNFMNNNNLVFTFLRSAVSSQAASWVDLGFSFILFAFILQTANDDWRAFISTAIGAVAGGIVNCIINYRFTFHASHVPWKAVVVKYTMVWLGSLLLNSFGTQGVYYVISNWTWLEQLGFRPDGYFAAARLLVSLLVSWFWNFALQRYFVYRVSSFDPTAIRLVDGIQHVFRHTQDNRKTK